MSADQHHIGTTLGHAGCDRADTGLRHQLDTDSCSAVGVFKIMDQLCQILNRINIVMWRR